MASQRQTAICRSCLAVPGLHVGSVAGLSRIAEQWTIPTFPSNTSTLRRSDYRRDLCSVSPAACRCPRETSPPSVTCLARLLLPLDPQLLPGPTPPAREQLTDEPNLNLGSVPKTCLTLRTHLPLASMKRLDMRSPSTQNGRKKDDARGLYVPLWSVAVRRPVAMPVIYGTYLLAVERR